MVSKKCRKCDTEKEISEFGKNKFFSDGLARYCKLCTNKYGNEYYHKNPKKAMAYRLKYRIANPEKTSRVVRANQLKSKYGINQQDYNNMLKEQNGVCAICGLPEKANNPNNNGKKKGLSIDHCHETGKVRGLLCGNCNTGLGYFKDNLDLLASTTSYLINSDVKVAV